MDKVIVTGANGFIGRNLIKYLMKKDMEIYALDISHEESLLKETEQVHLIECSLEDINNLKDKIEKQDYQAFYHLAWAGTTGPARADYQLQTMNAKYTVDAAIMSKQLGCKRFITTGSITELVADEIIEQQYSSENLIYGLAKSYTHKLLDITCRKYDIDYIWARLSNIYGGDNTNGNLISYTLGEFKKGKVPTYGPCLQPYNFTYIDDVIEALYLFSFSDHTYNEYFISNGECRILKDYLTEISKIYFKSIEIGKRKDDGVKYKEEWFVNDRLNDIGFTPKYSFKLGIEKIRNNEKYG